MREGVLYNSLGKLDTYHVGCQSTERNYFVLYLFIHVFVSIYYVTVVIFVFQNAYI